MRNIIVAQAKYTPYERENDKPMNFKDFITVSDLASSCDVTRRTVYNWLKAGKAPRHEVMSDDRIYFYPQEAAAFSAKWKRQHDR
jgi:predicted DNA-binding transcriptional regulator AlpA